MKNKNIAIVIENAFLYAGTENVCNFMSDCLGVKNNVDILSLCGSPPSFYPFKFARRIISFNNKRLKLNEVVKYIKKESYDAVYIISMGRLSVFFSIFMKFHNLDSSKVFSCEHVSLRSFGLHVRFLKFLTLRLYKKVIVLTDDDSLILKRWNVKNSIIKNPVFFKAYERKNFNKKALAIGRLSPQKGFDRLLYIWSLFISNNAGWTLEIAGDGPEHNNLINLVDNLGIKSSVTFLGRVDDVGALYRDSDIFLMTSWYEGLPLVLLEAKSWSLPVISYNCPTGPAEIIEDGVDGFLVENDNYLEFLGKLQLISNNYEQYKKLSENCIVSSIKFSPDAISNLWCKTLD